MTLRPTRTWGRFYAEQRMLPYARRARDLGHLSAAARRRAWIGWPNGSSPVSSTTTAHRPGSTGTCGPAT